MKPESLHFEDALSGPVLAFFEAPEWRACVFRCPSIAQRHYVLRAFVAHELGCDWNDVTLSHDANGAPLLSGAGDGWSVSSTSRDNYLGLAFGRHPLGIDLEILGPAHEPAWNILHASERAWLKTLDGDSQHEAFIKIWTLKEAYLKALRTGLNREPALINTLPMVQGSVEDDGESFVLRSVTTQRIVSTSKILLISVVMQGLPHSSFLPKAFGELKP